MKLTMKTLLVAASFVVSAHALANADDRKWINKCIIDNVDEGQTSQVVKSYCTCMNELMDENETKSITQWEKTHPKEEEKCSAIAGWKSKKK